MVSFLSSLSLLLSSFINFLKSFQFVSLSFLSKVTMTSISHITRAMNDVILEDEEEEVLAIENLEGNDLVQVFDAKLCLIGRFITKGLIAFQAMQQTLTTLWKPGKGVLIKEIDMNLYMFQFYHDIDIKRVIAGIPW